MDTVAEEVQARSATLDAGPTAPLGLPLVDEHRGTLTLVEGTAFCVSARDGRISAGLAHGLFVKDTRVISHWRVDIDGAPLEPLTGFVVEPYHASFVGRALPRAGRPEATIVVERQRFVAAGMREDIVVRNFGTEPAAIEVVVEVDADFADLFEVKDRRHARILPIVRDHTDSVLSFRLEGNARGVRVMAEGAQVRGQSLVFRPVVPVRGSWSASVRVIPSVDGRDVDEAFPADRPIAVAGPARRLRTWRENAPRISVENEVLTRALVQSERDLGALRIEDPEHPDDDVVAAGAPWFMALFGRDSLITSTFMVPFVPQLAFGTLRTLARLQGTKVDPRTEEEPGRILHEVRLGADASLALGGDHVYYGSVDATPLFVQLCGRLQRWGAPEERLREFRPAVEAALQWLVEFGDRDGDGFVEYQRASDRGLLNQGWKDSEDSMSFADGRLASGPIALAEVQAYTFAAFQAAAQLYRSWGEPTAAQEWADRADRLRRDFHAAFWLPELGCYAMALDRDKRPLDVVSSNAGHVLWTGLADDAVTDQLVDRLLAPDMFTGFGIRTLSSEAAQFNPASYHNGSVWPHDSTIVAAGMARSGRRDAAATVTRGLVDAMEAFGGQLPELFCGFDRTPGAAPVPYPTSCLPQAWAAAAPYELLRLSLDLHLDLTRGTTRAAGTPDFVGKVVIDGLRAADRRIVVRADPDGAVVDGLPDGLRSTN